MLRHPGKHKLNKSTEKNTNTNKLTIKHTEKNVYLLEGECVVSVEESEAVSTGLQLSKAVLAVPVLVTAEIVGIKYFEKKGRRTFLEFAKAKLDDSRLQSM